MIRFQSFTDSFPGKNTQDTNTNFQEWDKPNLLGKLSDSGKH